MSWVAETYRYKGSTLAQFLLWAIFNMIVLGRARAGFVSSCVVFFIVVFGACR
ncbi:WzyE family oligosaccharide polymerase [Shigella flexneri]